MKLKNLLIICLVFSFFMAVAVSPAVAGDFMAEVSLVTDFNDSVNLMPIVKDVDATPDTSYEADYWPGKAVISDETRRVHVGVDFNNPIKRTHIEIEYWDFAGGGFIVDAINPPGFITGTSSSSGGDFNIPKRFQETVGGVDWIRIIVTDEDYNDPCSSWIKADMTL